MITLFNKLSGLKIYFHRISFKNFQFIHHLFVHGIATILLNSVTKKIFKEKYGDFHLNDSYKRFSILNKKIVFK